MFRQRILKIFLISFLLIGCGLNLAEPHALKYDDKEFNDLADLIIAQQAIYEMDDFTRHYKAINGVPIKLKNNEDDQYVQFLNFVLDSLNIDPKMVSALRSKLEATKLRYFTMSGDSILFTVDGFLDNSWGFMYAKRGLVMDFSWFMFKGHSIKFVENINNRWKRAAIR